MKLNLITQQHKNIFKQNLRLHISVPFSNIYARPYLDNHVLRATEEETNKTNYIGRTLHTVKGFSVIYLKGYAVCIIL